MKTNKDPNYIDTKNPRSALAKRPPHTAFLANVATIPDPTNKKMLKKGTFQGYTSLSPKGGHAP